MKKAAVKSAAQLLGALGGKARAKNNSPAQLRAWAKLGGKAGGRPKGSKDTKPRKPRTTKKGGKK